MIKLKTCVKRWEKKWLGKFRSNYLFFYTWDIPILYYILINLVLIVVKSTPLVWSRYFVLLTRKITGVCFSTQKHLFIILFVILVVYKTLSKYLLRGICWHTRVHSYVSISLLIFLSRSGRSTVSLFSCLLN